MFRKLICCVLSLCLVFAFCPAVLANAQPYYDDDTYWADLEDGSTCNLAVGGRMVIPDGYEIQFSKDGVASYDEAAHTIVGTKAGTVTVTYTEKTEEDDPTPADTSAGQTGGSDEDDDADDYWDDDDDPFEGEIGTFTLRVYSYDKLSGKTYRCARAAGGWEPATLTIKAKGIDEDAGSVVLINDSKKSRYNKKQPDASLDSADNNRIVLSFERTGTHTVTLAINGKQIKIKVTVVSLKLNKSYVMLCKGKTATLKVSKAKKVRFTTNSPLVAKANKQGKVTPRQLGNCTITAVADGLTFSCAVSVTSKKAYQAVKNAESDYKKKMVYSQANRMSANARDCSSYVSRSYWDPSLGRKIYAIGGSSVAGTWALPAAEQAQWLNKHGKRVAYKAVSANKLLPGDTVYLRFDYQGINAGYRHIDHAAIYVGGGLILNTSDYGVKKHGPFAYSGYYAGDATVKFIARPISSFMLDRAAVTLKAGKTTTLKALFKKGTVKYQSSNAKVASVSSSGKVVAKKHGSCTIKATCKAGTYRCKVTVR